MAVGDRVERPRADDAAQGDTPQSLRVPGGATVPNGRFAVTTDPLLFVSGGHTRSLPRVSRSTATSASSASQPLSRSSPSTATTPRRSPRTADRRTRGRTASAGGATGAPARPCRLPARPRQAERRDVRPDRPGGRSASDSTSSAWAAPETRLQPDRARPGVQIEHPGPVQRAEQRPTGREVPSRARSLVGRVPRPGGTASRRPPALPAITRRHAGHCPAWRRSRHGQRQVKSGQVIGDVCVRVVFNARTPVSHDDSCGLQGDPGEGRPA